MKIIKLSDNREMVSAAAEWFSSKWNVPKEAYKESMEASFSATVPSWYLCLDDDRIVAGMGVIENDFHDRKDLTPNVCAVLPGASTVSEAWVISVSAQVSLACQCANLVQHWAHLHRLLKVEVRPAVRRRALKTVSSYARGVFRTVEGKSGSKFIA